MRLNTREAEPYSQPRDTIKNSPIDSGVSCYPIETYIPWVRPGPPSQHPVL